ncbi:MAG: 2-amino-4-hydroxy-6-hydroxymethyldihydropteridine diphosphokinase [Pseudomonadota bacterium]
MICFIALGANKCQADGTSPAQTLRAALADVDALPSTALMAASGLYQSAPLGPGRQRPYVNAVAGVDTDLSAADFMGHLHSIEAKYGRARSGIWHARRLDLDIVDYAADVTPQWQRQARRMWPPRAIGFSSTPLTLPHPRAHQRAFVLLPLHELCPNWLHPVFQVTVARLIKGQALLGIRRLGPLTL